MDAEQRQRILGFFLEETREHLESLTEGFADLGAIATDTERKTDLYRAAHSIKGGSAMLELPSIQRIAYRMESCLKQLKDGPIPTPQQLQPLLQEGLAGLATLVEELGDSYEISDSLSSQVLTQVNPALSQLEDLIPRLLSETTPKPREVGRSAHSTAAPSESAQTTEALPITEAGLGATESSDFDALFGGFDAPLDQTAASFDSLGFDSPGFDSLGNDLSLELGSEQSLGADLGLDLTDLNLTDLNLTDLNNRLDLSSPNLDFDPEATEVGPLDFESLFGDATPPPAEPSRPTQPPVSPPPPAPDAALALAELFSEEPWEQPTETTDPLSDELAPTRPYPSAEIGLAAEVEPPFAESEPNPDGSSPSPDGDWEFDTLDSELDDTSTGQNQGLAVDPPLTASNDPWGASFDLGEDEPSPLAADSTNWDDLSSLLDSSNETSPLLDTLSSPFETMVQGDGNSSFDELSDLLSSAPSPRPEASSPSLGSISNDDFSELDALLGSPAPSPTPAIADDFSDLDAMLGTPSLGTPAPPSAHSSVSNLNALSSPKAPKTRNQSDDFGDLESILQQTEQAGKTSSNPSAAAPTRNRMTRILEQNMRVPVKTLDHLSNLVGEMVVNRNSLEGDQERLSLSLETLVHHAQMLSDAGQRLQDFYERSLLESALINSRRKFAMGSSSANSSSRLLNGATSADRSSDRPGLDRSSVVTSSAFDDLDDLELDRFSDFHLLAQDIIEQVVRVRESSSDIEFLITESLEQVTRNFRQITTQLQESVNKARMVPFSQTSARLPRAVRDISNKCGKKATLIVEGEDTLIDKMLVEQLHDPLTHLVNNAVTHGIETPEERMLIGKSEQGNIKVQVFHQGNQTVISVSDDGAGIDAERVKRKAIEKRLLNPNDAKTIPVNQVYDFLFHPGFSTRDQADAFAGRGVGMDVVRTRIQELRGTIITDSTLGKGTSFTIRLPLTLSITKALSCISHRARIAFPLDGVEEMFDIPKETILLDEQGHTCIPWRDEMLPLRPLSDLLRYNRQMGRSSVYGGAQDDDMIAVVILRGAGEFLAVQVDRMESEVEIAIKQLEGPVPKPAGIAGATVLKDGQIMPIADVLELIDLARGRTRSQSQAMQAIAAADLASQGGTPTDPLVLIIDDSITVRELLSMSFTKAGYRVEQARDGQEAWEKLRAGLPCNLVFCDIEMPRMTGLELLEKLQQDETLRDLPIAMLTSRGADKHRQIAADLGARGYFTKPYLEEVLLDAAKRLMQGERLVD